MDRLTIDNGLDEVCFKVQSDREGAYNILDIAEYSNREEMQEILLNIASRLAEYEDIGLSPKEIKKVIYGGVPEWIPKYMEYRELEHYGSLIKLPCKVKEFISLLNSLKYPDKLFIYDDKELVWQGYINEKQIYKYLEDEEVIEIYLGEDGLIAKVA